MRGLAHQAEASGVVMEGRQREQQAADQQRGAMRHLAELHFRVEFFLELGEFGGGGLIGHGKNLGGRAESSAIRAVK